MVPHIFDIRTQSFWHYSHPETKYNIPSANHRKQDTRGPLASTKVLINSLQEQTESGEK